MFLSRDEFVRRFQICINVPFKQYQEWEAVLMKTYHKQNITQQQNNLSDKLEKVKKSGKKIKKVIAKSLVMKVRKYWTKKDCTTKWEWECTMRSTLW